jgi:hypothetical protein
MAHETNRRNFIKASLAAPAAALSMQAQAATPTEALAPQGTLPTGRIGSLDVSRVLLGGNLLTHFTHSRDLRYVYNLAAQYNTPEKIMETLALSEAHGVNTLVVHTVPAILDTLKKYRERQGGKMQWIICSTAPIEEGLEAYQKSMEELMEMGTESIYVWGVRADKLVSEGKAELLAETVALTQQHGIPTGIGAHDLNVVKECEKQDISSDFYIKTFHHHEYPTAPTPEQITGPHTEIPGYWCSDPEETLAVMSKVEKPWMAFKIMAAGAIPPKNAIPYAFTSGADHILLGMFDFEIAEDTQIARDVLQDLKRERPWRS